MQGISFFYLKRIQQQLTVGVKNALMLGECQQRHKLVGFFHWSYKMTYALKEKQHQSKVEQHKLIQDCVTRLGSTVSMIERILEQRVAVCAALTENRSDYSLMPTADELL